MQHNFKKSDFREWLQFSSASIMGYSKSLRVRPAAPGNLTTNAHKKPNHKRQTLFVCLDKCKLVGKNALSYCTALQSGTSAYLMNLEGAAFPPSGPLATFFVQFFYTLANLDVEHISISDVLSERR